MIDGEAVLFDADDYHMKAGDRTVVIGKANKIEVVDIVGHYDGMYLTPQRATRSAFIKHVSGSYLPGTQSGSWSRFWAAM